MTMTRDNTEFTEFVLDDAGQIEAALFPIIAANRRSGIKTLVLSKHLEDDRIHVVCVGVVVPEGVLPTAEFARIDDNRDLRSLASGGLQQFEGEF